MTFTYSAAALTSALSQVRFLIPDNVDAGHELEDEEISYLLTLTGQNVTAAAVKACRQLSRKYGREMTFGEAGAKYEASLRSQTFAARADELEKELGGGISPITIKKVDGYSEAAES